MLIFSIIGTLIGAGFASGQEIYVFFYKYGINGILGLILCSFMIGITIYMTLDTVYNKKINNYESYLHEIFNSKKMCYVSNIIVNVFLLITFYIMVAGFGSYFEQQFNISNTIGVIIFSFLCFIVLIKDIERVKKVNSIIVPTLIIVILVLGLLSLKQIKILNIKVMNNSYNWILQSLVYCSYNMILVIPVLVSLGKYIKNKNQIKLISIISSTIVFILALSIFLILMTIKVDYTKIQMPAVYAIDKSFSQFSYIYGVVILLSIFSTAISIGISFINNMTQNKKSYPQIAAKMCISSIIISNFGFSNLVKIFFPIFGYLGMVQIICILKKFITKK